jgi:2-polyprenyl-3-methyl-5-hydroxy-6-metoxy-1,4-benzoquinol methylase
MRCVQRNDSEIGTCFRANCYLCSSQGKLLYEGLTDHLFGSPGNWNLMKCTNTQCGLIWLNPMPLEKDIGKAYLNYFTHNSCCGNSQDKVIRKFIWLTAWRFYRMLLFLTWIQPERKKRNGMYLLDRTPGKLLDVGSGNGQFLALMRNKGWDIEGQEVDPKAAETALKTYGINVKIGELKSIGYSCDNFDAVVMSHVIEHVHDPIETLNECRRILKPGGTLVLVTPNAESFGHRYFKSWYRGLEPPRHLYLFTQKTLQHIAKKAGFADYRVWTAALDIVYNVAAGSLDIKRDSCHVMEANPKTNRFLEAMLFHLVARVFFM